MEDIYYMNTWKQLLVLLLSYFLHGACLKSFIHSCKKDFLGEKEYERRKTGQNILEWFFYTRYLDIIPKFFLILNWLYFLLFVIGNITCIVIGFFPSCIWLGHYIAIGIITYYTLQSIILYILFRRYGGVKLDHIFKNRK